MKKITLRKIIARQWILLLFTLFSGSTSAAVTLDAYFSDGMVLQRDTALNIYGAADVGEKVTVRLNKQDYHAVADSDGQWTVNLPPQSVARNQQIRINDIIINNVAFGDVWLVSGQSNMAFPVAKVLSTFPEQTQRQHYPDIRQFKVPLSYDFSGPKQQLQAGQWRLADQQTVKEFSAVAWFFADALARNYDVPIAIVNSSVGGTPIEAWMSEQSLAAYPEQLARAHKYQDSAQRQAYASNTKNMVKQWQLSAKQNDMLLQAGADLLNDANTYADWPTLALPGQMKLASSDFKQGSIWLHKRVTLSAQQANSIQARLLLGNIRDNDITYVNGVKVGQTASQYQPRRYALPNNLLQAGDNFITTRVEVMRGQGALIQGKKYCLQLQNQCLDLSGEWQYQVAAKMPALPRVRPLHWHPTGLYNAMIAPLAKLRFKGVIWYQGEGNTPNADQYQDLMSSMIDDWRSLFANKELPFLYVQLANFGKVDRQPAANSSWANLRQAQTDVLQSMPHTAMALAIDVGESNDIHPQDKKTVGERLALAARYLAYHEDVQYRNMQLSQVDWQHNKALLSFANMVSGIEIKGEEIRGFAIAGSDGKFVWAKAKTHQDKIVVWHPNIAAPAFIRYGWGNNPVRVNVYNSEQLPLIPFSVSKDRK
ncbi:sialate O-acetylesterase [Thalassotalea sp. HSM 43]|uniref:sialate O-acetylesterase n=1 Tax=Thalassotalea sp. HSM 43 TaxID=2552945 RepID=UPI00108206D4|nr:sialate O-acetylesterase [Thalassotalea sp. HSM 43]QBY04213.1 sialate O-acetylesterase [Thalassotalea sp. HSM 43]